VQLAILLAKLITMTKTVVIKHSYREEKLCWPKLNPFLKLAERCTLFWKSFLSFFHMHFSSKWQSSSTKRCWWIQRSL